MTRSTTACAQVSESDSSLTKTVKTLFARESISLVFSGLMRLVRRVK